MPPRAATLLRLVTLLLTALLGKLPLLMAALLGLAIRQCWLAYGQAVGLTFCLVLLGQDSTPTLRWGPVGWPLYHRLPIDGVPALLGDLVLNLACAVLGVAIGRAARMGYLDARPGSHPE
jgi:hypothetical protein